MDATKTYEFKYKELKEKLELVYGECDGLLETVVDHLVKHPEIEFGKPAKTKLLTDEDVDKWERWKKLEGQGDLNKQNPVLFELEDFLILDKGSEVLKKQFENYCNWCWGHEYGNCDSCRRRFNKYYIPIRKKELIDKMNERKKL